ncbi:MAG TPA: DUF5703 family protein [Mycobacteriales bacterium]|jgi:uncharacterized protein DUF5703|nr:DUF5703 family protein [Mycobacteriales bacterium]
MTTAIEAVVEGDYEYAPVRIPPGTNRVSAAVLLSVQAEYGGWELSRLRLRTDGSRQVVLRRKRNKSHLPGPLL